MRLWHVFQEPSDESIVADARARVERSEFCRLQSVITGVVLVVLACWSLDRVFRMLIANLIAPGPGAMPGGLDFATGVIVGGLIGGHLSGIGAAAAMVVSSYRPIRLLLLYYDVLATRTAAFAAIQPYLVPPPRRSFFLTSTREVSVEEYVGTLRDSLARWERYRHWWYICFGSIGGAILIMLLSILPRMIPLITSWNVLGMLMGFLMSVSCTWFMHRRIDDVITPRGGMHFERALVKLHDACVAEGLDAAFTTPEALRTRADLQRARRPGCGSRS